MNNIIVSVISSPTINISHWNYLDAKNYVEGFKNVALILPSLQDGGPPDLEKKRIHSVHMIRKPNVYMVNLDKLDSPSDASEHYNKFRNCLVVIPASNDYITLKKQLFACRQQTDMIICYHSFFDISEFELRSTINYRIHANPLFVFSLDNMAKIIQKFGQDKGFALLVAQYIINRQYRDIQEIKNQSGKEETFDHDEVVRYESGFCYIDQTNQIFASSEPEQNKETILWGGSAILEMLKADTDDSKELLNNYIPD
uniref:Uncharacterized protein n=1 Tax=viral metagenome TaxID=1070528 RepID=A0A6M3J5Z0_9ZZZZ